MKMKIKFKKCPRCNDNIKPLGFRSHYSKCKGIFKDIQHKVILKENYYNCPKCKDSISKFAFSRHLRSCKGIFKDRRVVILKEKSIQPKIKEFKKFNKDQVLCLICNKIFSENGFKTHYRRLHTEKGKLQNPNIGYINGTRKPSNQFIKAKKEGKILKVSLETIEKIYKTRSLNGFKFKIQQSLFKNIVGVEYKMQSSWERKFAEFLNKNNILWEKCKDKYPYVDMFGNNKKYIPDFYLLEFGVFIEIKGRTHFNDIFKWKYFPKKLIVLKQKDLKELKIL